LALKHSFLIVGEDDSIVGIDEHLTAARLP
jgi:hypothetical protein